MNRRRNLYLIAALFIFGGAMHFVIPDRYSGIMPPWLPYPLAMVYLSGLLEIAGGIGVLVPSVHKAAGLGLIALLTAVFPANVQMLANAIAAGGSTLYITLLFLRLPLQPLMIVWIYRAAVRTRVASQVPRTNL